MKGIRFTYCKTTAHRQNLATPSPANQRNPEYYLTGVLRMGRKSNPTAGLRPSSPTPKLIHRPARLISPKSVDRMPQFHFDSDLLCQLPTAHFFPPPQQRTTDN